MRCSSFIGECSEVVALADWGAGRFSVARQIGYRFDSQVQNFQSAYFFVTA